MVLSAGAWWLRGMPELLVAGVRRVTPEQERLIIVIIRICLKGEQGRMFGQLNGFLEVVTRTGV